jgi:sulfopropanediol 3-dehydrogenase
VPEYLKAPARAESAVEQHVRSTVSEILLAVEREGEAAVRRFSERFDGWSPPSFRVAPVEVERAEAVVGDELRKHIEFALQQVRNFASLQKDSHVEFEVQTLPGVLLGQKLIPVNAVGSYSPGGRFPLVASSLMTIAVPKVAGVPRVAACAPPQKAVGIHPPQLFAMSLAGADEIFCIGGVQALAALAFGLEDLEPVDLLVGAGNAYVAEAKRQLFGTVGIDLLAGPTEVLVLADETADPELVAIDLLGQAEHGPTSPATLVTTSEALGHAVIGACKRLLETWPTADTAGPAWHGHGAVVVCVDDEEMAEVADGLAAEHVEVHTKEPEWFLRHLTNYGSLFLGEFSTVAYGDKAVGTNHVLPTRRAARYTGGLSVGTFLKCVTYEKVSAAGTFAVAPAVVGICDAEMMAGHALTARARLERAAGTGIPPEGARK